LKSLKQFPHSTEKVEKLKGLIIFLFRMFAIANALMVGAGVTETSEK